MPLSSLLAKPLELLWPAACAACDRHLPRESAFCAECALSLSPLAGACSGCALPRGLAASVRDAWNGRCGRCRRVPFPFATATAALEYGEAIADAIVRMKHGARRDLGRRLGQLLVGPAATVCAQAELGAADVVVPVPLHVTRLRKRGFNQAVELARGALAGLKRTPGLAPDGGLPRLERRLLLRTRATRELGHAGPAARLAEVVGAFAVADTERVRGRRVLLVDDVMTTGATASECAEALLRAGAVEVHVLALARAV